MCERGGGGMHGKKTVAVAALLACAGHVWGESMTEALKPCVDSNWVAGAVASVVASNGVLETACVGCADRETGRLMTPDTVFWLASVTKVFTGTAFMMLVDDGKVKPDDTLDRYLPAFKTLWVQSEESTPDKPLLRTARNPVLLWQLMDHRSGLPFLAPYQRQKGLASIPLEEAVAFYALMPLVADPGTKWSYSNAGLNTLARVIEVASGMSFETFLRRRLLDPLGMTETTFFPTAAQWARLAKTYQPDEKLGLRETENGFMRLSPDDPPRHAEAGGGLFSTPRDMEKFARFFVNRGVWNGRRLLSESGVAGVAKYGSQSNRDSFGHDGALRCNFRVYPQAGLSYVWLVQYTGKEWGGNQAVAQERARSVGLRNAGHPDLK